jgi:orotidine-5'-phosphate decarboxylase
MKTEDTNYRNRIIVALDTPDLGVAKTLIGKLKDHVSIFKVGSELFTSCGPRAVELVREAGKDVFLDLKFNDIPNTVARAVRAASKLGVSILNVHASGGLQMMQEACIASVDEAQKHNQTPPKLIGVTLLTSLSEDDAKNEIGLAKSIEQTALHYAVLAQKAGLDGVVASALELKKIREKCGTDFLIVTPGIRPGWASKDDQERVLTPSEAFELGSSYIVIGRPVTGAEDPTEAMSRILEELNSD